MLVENCYINETLATNVFRVPGCTIAGTDFDELPGQGVSYWHAGGTVSTTDYRRTTGMLLHHRHAARGKRFTFDGEWSQYVLRLREGEFACYSLYDVTVLSRLEVACYAETLSRIEVRQDETLLGCFDLSAAPHRQTLSGMQLNNADACVLKLKVIQGTVDIETLRTETDV